jgi:hypothetical protein
MDADSKYVRASMEGNFLTLLVSLNGARANWQPYTKKCVLNIPLQYWKRTE